MIDRVILHSDCNSFFASVEEVLEPRLKKYPMAVCGNAENRHGIILAKNQLAKRFNILTAETIAQAKRKCPDLVLVEPHYSKYSEYSDTVNQIYHSFTDQVEPFGIDESWLDVTGSRLLFGNGRDIAERIRKSVRENTGITVSVGVSFNKVFAKLGSDYKKPDAVTEITRLNFRDIVYPLPVTDLFMVGQSTADMLGRMGIKTIGELAGCSREFLAYRLGKMGEILHSYASGMEFSPVISLSDDDTPKSVGNGMTFKRNLVTREDILLGVTAIADEVSSRLRRIGLKCNCLQVSLKNANFKTISKQRVLSCAVNSQRDICNESMSVVDMLWKNGMPVRSLTITCTHLSASSHFNKQIEIFENAAQSDRILQHERIDGAVDKIRSKYGRNIIFSASLLKNDIGL